MRFILLNLVLCFAVTPATPAGACCMVPLTYRGTISQTAQEAIILQRDGREELILRINYRIDGAEAPDHFAWVVTVPNQPDAYAVADHKLFAEAFAWTEKTLRIPSRQKGLDRGLLLSPEVRVGPYRIQPVKGVGARAVQLLNEWLTENGFPNEDPDHMKYFVDEGFTFLCVRFDPKQGESGVPKRSAAPPLHLSFASEQPYYPLRFSSRQGVFDVNLTLLTGQPLDYEESSASLKKINWAKNRSLRTNVRVDVADFPKALAKAYGKTKFKGDTPWYLNRLTAKRVNKGNTIAKWKTDVFFRTKSI